ncbi:MAG: restriction endonuclease [Coriobacteriia bacterium]|nr:MAG: restriction endonuclease [Coriobacteriia bacterium]
MMACSTTTQPDTGTLATITQAQQLGLVGASTLSVPMPFESKIVLFESIRVAGTSHAPDIDATMGQMPDEARLSLVREPDNQTDGWAIRVEHDGKKIGYMPADKNEVLARLMDGGKTLSGELVSRELRGTWWNVHMEVYLID